MRTDVSGWLLRFDGRPTPGAQLAIVAIVATAFFATFVVRATGGSDASGGSDAVPESRLTGEIVPAAERTRAPRLRHAAALPALARAERRRARSKTRRKVAAFSPVQTKAPSSAKPAPASTPAPTAAPPTSTAPIPVPSEPDPPSPPGETFDSSG